MRLWHWTGRDFVQFTHLEKADVVGVLPEALTAQAETVLADQAMVVGAGSATEGEGKVSMWTL